MTTRTLAVTEVRRRLPELVEQIARDGGRVDVTVRGQSRVSIVRTEGLDRRRGRAQGIPSVLTVRLNVPAADLVGVIRDLRSRVGEPRALPRRPSGRSRGRR